MIAVEGLAKCYGNVLAVGGISFTIEAGEIVSLLGPNGAGKTSTIKMLTGCMPATAGRVRIDGHDVSDAPMVVRRRMGYLPEVSALYPNLRVLEYLRFIGRLKGLRGKGLRDEIDRVVHRTHVAAVVGRLIHQLSKGFQERVGFAQALLGDPDVLILDEPTLGLDPRQAGEMRLLIKDLAVNHTVLLSTHTLQEVIAMCSRVLILNKGIMVADMHLDKGAGPRGERCRVQGLEELFLSVTEV